MMRRTDVRSGARRAVGCALAIPGLLLAMAAGEASAAKRLVVALPAEVVILDPPQYSDLNSERVMSQIFDPFIQVAEDGFRKVPGLVERWDISSDGLTYTFRLRRGVKFHDGSPWTAEAAKFNFDRQMDKNHPYYGTGTWTRAASYLVPFIERLEVVDELTLRMVLKARNAVMLDYLSHGMARMASMEAIKKWGKDFPAHPVGTGPFRFVSWEKGVRLVLEKNPQYWGGTPKVDELVFLAIPEASARFVAVKTGTADMTIDVPVDELAGLQRDQQFRVDMIPSTQVLFIVFNTKTKPLDDIRVRRALNLAVDKDTIVNEILKGTGVSARGPISPAFGDLFDRNLQGFPYAPDRAKQLLREASWPADRTLTFNVPESGSGMQAPQAIGTMIQANLQAVGVRTTMRTFEWGAYLTKFRAGEYDLGMLSWNLGVVGDPIIMLSGLLHSGGAPPKGWNSGGYAKPEVDGILDGYRNELVPARRGDLIRQVQRLTQDDPPWIYVDHQILPVVTSRKVKNLRVHPSLLFLLVGVDIEG